MEQRVCLATTREAIGSSFVPSIYETSVHGWSLVARLRDRLDVLERKESLNHTQSITSIDFEINFQSQNGLILQQLIPIIRRSKAFVTNSLNDIWAIILPSLITISGVEVKWLHSMSKWWEEQWERPPSLLIACGGLKLFFKFFGRQIWKKEFQFFRC